MFSKKGKGRARLHVLSGVWSITAYCSLRNEMGRNEMEILLTLVATKTSRIPRKAKRFFGGEIFCLEYPSTRREKGNVHFANYRFSDSHFANYRFPFRKLQISISIVSQTTVSRANMNESST